jgi:GDP-4-dehydro-6-deoxy-D-mannose reductase
MRCLITGATGFVGRHLAKALQAGGHEVVGLAKHPAELGFPVYNVDLLDTPDTLAVIRDVRPEWLFHLAGYANAGKSFREPAQAWVGNLDATFGLYDAIARSPVRPRILYVSSGLVYGDAGKGEQVFTEDAPLRPASPYAASKAAADLLSFQQSRSPGLDIVRVRPFNQIGPGQPADYAAPSFARQIVAVERGQAPHVEVRGDLNARRDLTDVRDMVRAYVLLMEVAKAGEVYNAGSGRTYQIQEILDRLIALAGVPVRIEENPDRSRTMDTTVSRADNSKLREATGWEPTVPLEQTLTDLLAFWRGPS